MEQFLNERAVIEHDLQIICEEHSFAPVLAVNEAVNNALIHGAGQNYGDVRITIKLLGGRKLLIRVKDSGQGFSTAIPLLNIENNWEEGGRGRFLMESLMDQVRYNRTGNSVLLIKNLKS